MADDGMRTNEPAVDEVVDELAPAVGVEVDDLAVISVVSGVMALMFALFAGGTFLHGLALLTGAPAVVTGYKAVKAEADHQEQALWGLIAGAAALSLWLIGALVR